MSPNSAATLEIEDLQVAVLHPRPAPYAGTLFVRVDDRRTAANWLGGSFPSSPSLAWARSVNPGRLWRSPLKG
jgi:hypothetical protein